MSKTIGTYFKSIKLKNVRSFGQEQVLDLMDRDGNLAQWTLLVGDNGVGKTTLLECFGWMKPVREGSAKAKTLGIGPALPREENEVLENLLRLGENEVNISAEVCQGTILNTPIINKPYSTTIKITFENEILADSNPSWLEEKKFEKNFGEFKEPFLIAYGANRHKKDHNTDDEEMEEPVGNRLSHSTALYDLEEILTDLDYAALKKKYKGKENSLLEKIKESLAKILPNNKSADNIKIEAGKFSGDEFKKSSVKLDTFSGLVPISRLSLGYQSMLALVLDLAWRLVLNYPKSRNPLKESAVVLIDEIDLHLHPQWQTKVMETLAGLFKGTQFIGTAHSPLMVQSKPTANFAIIKKVEHEVIIENEPEKIIGWRVDQILNSEYFNLDVSRTPETEELFKKRDKLLLKLKRSSAEEKQLKNLQDQILMLRTETNPNDDEVMIHLQKAAELLKSEN